MDTPDADKEKRPAPAPFFRLLAALTLAGAVAFWVANFAISGTPIAAEYRASLSIDYTLMLVESAIGGLFIGFIVSITLLRFFDRIPSKSPILKSVLLSVLVLAVATVFLGLPGTLLTPDDALRYFLIGVSFNVIRILALGIVIGMLYEKIQPSR